MTTINYEEFMEEKVWEESEVKKLLEAWRKNSTSIEKHLYFLELESFLTFSSQPENIRNIVESEINRVVKLADKKKYAEYFMKEEDKKYEEISDYVNWLFSKCDRPESEAV